jgi:CRISPR-associated protein Cas5d
MSTSTTSSPLLRLRVWGERACFTRPELKTERVSYDVMTPSAARGVLEAILWKPQMRWVVERIDVLNPVAWDSVRRNEVSQRASLDNVRTVMNGGSKPLGIDIEAARQQRAARILRDVAYVIHARVELTDKAGPDDSLSKYVEMFKRRAGAGQYFHRPYLGTREFAANFTLLSNDDRPSALPFTADLGRMLFDIDFARDPAEALFFSAHLKDGSLDVPHPDSAEFQP